MATRLKGKAIPGFPGYRVTRGGAVFSTKRGGCRRLKQEWSHAGHPLKDGHLRVALYRDGKRHWRYVHYLVARTYLGARPRGAQTCHRNGKRHDNRVSNLYYGTASDNAYDREHHKRGDSAVRVPYGSEQELEPIPF